MADETKKDGMTVAEAGRKGGVKVAAERGRAFYEQIGRKGGETVKAERGHEFYEQIGRKGGEKVRELIEQGKRMVRDAAAKNEQQPAPKLDELGNLKPNE